jgi:hypothetical protein
MAVVNVKDAVMGAHVAATYTLATYWRSPPLVWMLQKNHVTPSGASYRHAIFVTFEPDPW